MYIQNRMCSITQLCVICLLNNIGPFRIKTSIYYLPTLNHKKLDRIPVFDPQVDFLAKKVVINTKRQEENLVSQY